MDTTFVISPRYRLDDESPWLEGIDPSRNYWIRVNGEQDLTVIVPGLVVGSIEEWKKNIRSLRRLRPGEKMAVARVASELVVHCVGMNCYAIVAEIAGAEVWHLFDQETIKGLFMTSHPDWICAAKDLDLGRQMLTKSLGLLAA
jgi:hypothetical protein